MGNWTTVNITGTCEKEDVQALSDEINAHKQNDDWDKFHCLCNTGGLAGLGDWSGETISAVGNLAERDYSADSVAEKLSEIVKSVPSLDVVVNVGGDYESLDCIASVVCKDGKVTIEEPRVERLHEISETQVHANLMKALQQ